jgi:DNA-binding beta-propeller fold protein YncE
MIRTFAIDGSPQSFWGPRAVAVDSGGRVYVADTGYSRIVVFDSQGVFLELIGEPGFGPGQFSEPVGLAVSQGSDLYVADTWNRRVQVFRTTEATQWPIDSWPGDSPDNKPFVAASDQRQVCLSDPEQARILCFTERGEFLLGWETAFSSGSDLWPNGVAFDQSGHPWVTDGRGNSVRRSTPPFP